MRVVHVIPGLGGGGGAERSLLSDASLLRAEGIDLHLAILSERRGWSHSSRRSVCRSTTSRGRGATFVAPDRSVVSSTGCAPTSCRRPCSKQRFPCSSRSAAGVAGALRARDMGRYDLQRGAAQRAGPPTRASVQAFRLVDAALGRWSAAEYQAVTQGVADSNRAALWVPPDRVHVVGRGRVAPPDRDDVRRAATRASLGLGDGDRLALCVARRRAPEGARPRRRRGRPPLVGPLRRPPRRRRPGGEPLERPARPDRRDGRAGPFPPAGHPRRRSGAPRGGRRLRQFLAARGSGRRAA